MASEGSCTAVRAGDGPTPIVTADGVRSSSFAAEQVCSKQCCWHVTLLRSLPQFLLSSDSCTSLPHFRALLRQLLTSLPPFFFTMLPQSGTSPAVNLE